MWNEFNIKTFPAQTIVYRDGSYCADLSTLPESDINKNYDLPVHIIYVGEIENENNLNINVAAHNQPVFLSVDIKNKKPAFLNIFIKNTGKNSVILGQISVENNDKFSGNIIAHHALPDTTIKIYTKILGNAGSETKIAGTAQIDKNCENCVSDINFSALMDKSAKISFLPSQRIFTPPITADHGAAIFKPKPPQIQFLRTAGLSGAEIDTTLREAFINNNPLF